MQIFLPLTGYIRHLYLTYYTYINSMFMLKCNA